jgi:hypothetical protein
MNTYQFIDNAGETHGPATEEELVQLYIDGQINPTTRVRETGTDEWKGLFLVISLPDRPHPEHAALEGYEPAGEDDVPGEDEGAEPAGEPAIPAPPMPVTRGQLTVISLLLVAIIVLLIALLRQPAPQWEYRVESLGQTEFLDGLNTYGREGWDLVQTRSLPPKDGVVMVECLLKRPKP